MYYIEQECLKCDACKHTGWRLRDFTENKNDSKSLKKYWSHYFGRDIKIRIRIDNTKDKI